MTVKEYLRKSLNSLFTSEKEISKINYVFDYHFNQHVLVISPSIAFKTERFAKIQLEYELKFIAKFPNEELLIVTDGHGLVLPKFEFELTKKGVDTLTTKIDSIQSFILFSVSPFYITDKFAHVQLLMQPSQPFSVQILDKKTEVSFATTDLSDKKFGDDSSNYSTSKGFIDLNSPSDVYTLFGSSTLEAVSSI